MPIYAYLCSNCGLQKDLLQKMSDAPFTICPECGRDTFSKQLTSAGFQLKGSGYYATDFKNSGQTKAETKAETKTETKTAPAGTACSVAEGAV